MNAEKIGQLIAQRRREKGWTQKDLAEQLHVTLQAVSKWERGLNFPDIALLEPLAGCLELTVTQLLSGSREEAQPPEELVTESLRTFDGQWRRVLRRWRWLFVATAGLLIVLLLAGGYWWVKEYTELLPQRHTVVEPLTTGELETMVANTMGRRALLYNVALADDTEHCRFQMELWTPEGLGQTYLCGGLYWQAEDGVKPPRGAPLVFSYELALEEEPTGLEFGIGFCGATWDSGTLSDLPSVGGGVAISSLHAPTVVPDTGDGIVLACFSLDAGRGGVRAGPTGAGVQPDPAEGEVYLLLRMLCE